MPTQVIFLTSTIPPTATSIPTQISTTSTPTSIPTIAKALNTPTPSPAPYCYLKTKGDADCDNKITLLDFNIWNREFVDGTNGIATGKVSDFNRDGIISIVDFNIWKTNFQDTSLPH